MNKARSFIIMSLCLILAMSVLWGCSAPSAPTDNSSITSTEDVNTDSSVEQETSPIDPVDDTDNDDKPDDVPETEQIEEAQTADAPLPSDTPTVGQEAAASSSILSSNMVVHFLDVGQADSILIQLPNEQTMLIDGGNSSDANSILSYMRSLNIATIDYLIATHPHADHIGGLPSIINAMDVKSVYMPRVSHTTQTFERLLVAIQNKGLQVDAARAGVNILSVPDLHIDIVAPVRDNYSDLNDHSVVLKINYRDTSFLFTGDAEALSEGHITADVSADVLKVGHHGSNTSTSLAFLNRVSPTHAVISVGSRNNYGHPTDAVLSRLSNAGVNVYRTDLQGTVIITSDGSTITVNTQPTPYQPSAPPSASSGAGSTDGSSSSISSATPENPQSTDIIVFITRTGARYHLDGCRHLSQSKIESTLSAAKAQGLTACGTCRPPS